MVKASWWFCRRMLFVAGGVSLLSLAACGSGGDKVDIGPEIEQASAVDIRHVRIELSQAADERVFDPDSYVITHEDGSELGIVEVESVGSRNDFVLISTESQRPGLYDVELSGVFSGRSSTTRFRGSQEPELLLTDAVSLSNTEMLLTFNKDIDASLLAADAYRVVAQSGDVLSVREVLAETNPRQVLLETSSQQNVRYLIEINPDPSFLKAVHVDVTKNQGSTVGTSQNDTVPPRFTRVTVASPTELVLSFSEPITPSIDFASKASFDPPLQLFGFTTASRGTQIVLNTEPLQRRAYQLNLAGDAVSDLSEDANLLAADARRIVFLAEDGVPGDFQAPQLIGVDALSSRVVSAQFSEALDPSSLDPANFLIFARKPDGNIEFLEVTGTPTFRTGQQDIIDIPTEAQEGREYTLRVANIRDQNGNLLVERAVVDGVLIEAVENFIGRGEPIDNNGEAPRVVSAGALSNTCVVVQFSEPMDVSTAAPNRFEITQVNVNSEAAGLGVTAASFACSAQEESLQFCAGREASANCAEQRRDAVVLRTLSQSGVTYQVAAFNAVDAGGTPIAAPERGVDPRVAQFAGIPPIGGGVDSDGDGLTDDLEQRGWLVQIIRQDGQVEQIEVTSDPFIRDTDNDGLTDAEEFALRSNPRSGDTDGDGVSDGEERDRWRSNVNAADSDNDGLADGVEISLHATSPTLADSDGDGVPDREEIFNSNRNPRIAEIPIPLVRVGDVQLDLDVRYELINAQSQQRTEDRSFSTTLENSRQDALSSTDSTTNQRFSQNVFSQELELELKTGTTGVRSRGQFTVGFEQTRSRTRSHTGSVTTESASASREEAQRVNAFGLSEIETNTSARTIQGASVAADISFENRGDIAFRLSDIELTVLKLGSERSGNFVPVATLKPASDVDQPESCCLELFLGPLDGASAAGPFIFKNVNVFPSRVEELLRDPSGLITEVASFRLRDEEGRDFGFTSQDIFERTVGLVVDFGDRALDGRDRVSNSQIALNGEFDRRTAQRRGIELRELLTSVLGLRDLCPEGRLERLCPLPAPDGSGPEDAFFIGRQTVEELVFAADGSATTVEREVDVLKYFQGVAGFLRDGRYVNPDEAVQLGSLDNYWAVLASGSLAGADAVNIGALRRMDAGDTVRLALISDADQDGIPTREEYRVGTSDNAIDTDGDSLTDAFELLLGWEVSVDGRAPQRVYSSPVFGSADSDNDGLSDVDEFRCGTDPLLRDTDADGLSDLEELSGDIEIVSARITPYFGAGPEEGQIEHGRLPLSTPFPVGEGPDDFVSFCHSAPAEGEDVVPIAFATDPRKRDTDGDGIRDGLEVLLGLDPNNPSDGKDARDTDEDGLSDLKEEEGYVITVQYAEGVDLSGPNSCNPPNNAVSLGRPRDFEFRVTSDPQVIDTDGDGLPDLLERLLNSNPRCADSDRDGVSDSDEFVLSNAVSGEACVGSRNIRSDDSCAQSGITASDFRTECANLGGQPAAGCRDFDFSRFVIPDRQSTNLTDADTDDDSVFDGDENQLVDYVARFFDLSGTEQRADVDLDPRNPDTDRDGVPDAVEREGYEIAGRAGRFPSNGQADDTDGDGRLDPEGQADGTGRTASPVRFELAVNGDWQEWRNGTLECTQEGVGIAGSTAVVFGEFRLGLFSGSEPRNRLSDNDAAIVQEVPLRCDNTQPMTFPQSVRSAFPEIERRRVRSVGNVETACDIAVLPVNEGGRNPVATLSRLSDGHGGAFDFLMLPGERMGMDFFLSTANDDGPGGIVLRENVRSDAVCIRSFDEVRNEVACDEDDGNGAVDPNNPEGPRLWVRKGDGQPLRGNDSDDDSLPNGCFNDDRFVLSYELVRP